MRDVRKVAQLNKLGLVVAVYDSISDASRKTGLPKPNICACLNGRLKSVGGYGWRSANESTVVEAEMKSDTDKGVFRLPFTYQQICRNTDAALRIVGKLKEKTKGEPLNRAANILSAMTGICIGLDYYDEYLTVLFDSGFVIYVPKQPLADNFIVLLARLVLSCAKLHSDAGVFFIGYFDGRWVNIVRCGNDVDAVLKKMKNPEHFDC